jgi:hypothetical protein
VGHGPSINTISESTSIVVLSVAAGTCLPSHCLEKALHATVSVCDVV